MTGFKICGLTRPEDARLAAEVGASSVGVIFAPSPRQLDVERASGVVAGLPRAVARVGVFVDQPMSLMAEAVAACDLDWVQLSGDDPADVAAGIAELCQVRVMKAVHMSGSGDLERFADYPAHAWLLDAPVSGGRRGGTGRCFDWSVLERLARGGDGAGPLAGPVVVAGGLTPGNVGDAIRRLAPSAVDVCSGVESRPGIKDPALVRAFAGAVSAAVESAAESGEQDGPNRTGKDEVA